MVDKNLFWRYYRKYFQPIIHYGIFIYEFTLKRSLKPIHLLQKRFLRLNNFLSPKESTDELSFSHQIPNSYQIYFDELIKFDLKVAMKEFMVNSLKKLFVGNNNDTRVSSLGFHLEPKERNPIQKNSLTFYSTQK